MRNKIIETVKQMVEMEKFAGNYEVFDTVKRGTKKTGKITLEGVAKKISVCDLCPLAKTRTHAVPGEGNPKAELMFIGEAPGRDEDQQARPFVGRAGQLLTKIIEAIGLRREDVFIANILKCRPPENRNPLPGEIVKCSPYLVEQIDLVKPKIICALGKFAAQTLLNTEVPISKLRGKFHEYRGIKLMPTYHPAYLLRNPADKKEVWEDIKLVAKELGIEIPRKKPKD
ncbi:MAG: uracil-DNA glycosylase [Candidatus Omnitrophica bacterium]|nr:uracil-DNA glycosylase [Candidatus Omnitrophota bacterium]